MTPFRQTIKPNDKGLDVYAVRRALRRIGFTKLPKVGYTAGPLFESAVKAIQKRHGLKVDGIYGPVTHSYIATHFDKYGVYLYNKARIRHIYVNPFAHARVVAGRIDMGVDYHGTGPIVAIGDAVVIGNGGGGWPGGHYLLYQLMSFAGEHAGKYVYVAEAIEPIVKTGEFVKAGQTIAYFGPGAEFGFYPGIEIGWGSPELNVTHAASTGNTGDWHHSNSPSGRAFGRFLRQLGAPMAYDPGTGPTFV